MNLQTEFCPNQACPDRSKVGTGNIVSHRQKEKRCRCKTCGKTFSVTRVTDLYGLKTSHETVEQVITLLAHGFEVTAHFASWVARQLDDGDLKAELANRFSQNVVGYNAKVTAQLGKSNAHDRAVKNWAVLVTVFQMLSKFVAEMDKVIGR